MTCIYEPSNGSALASSHSVSNIGLFAASLSTESTLHVADQNFQEFNLLEKICAPPSA